MSEVLDLQVYSLLARLHEARDAGCRALREASEEQARELIRDARHRARIRIKDAAREKRRRVAEHCRRVRVELETRHRDARFAALGERLATCLGALPAALEARWQQQAVRRAWCRHVLEGAAQVLRKGDWALAVAPGIGDAERRELTAAAAGLAGAKVTVADDPALAAGLVVTHDGARYDGSTAGLLADRNGVQAALLAELAALEQRT